jgi:glutamate-1-semialdehyde 2,1-aminomutase
VASIVWIALQQESPTRADQIEKAGIEKYGLIHAELLDSGLYLPPSGYEVFFVSSAHTEEQLDFAAEAIAGAILRHFKV